MEIVFGIYCFKCCKEIKKVNDVEEIPVCSVCYKDDQNYEKNNNILCVCNSTVNHEYKIHLIKYNEKKNHEKNYVKKNPILGREIMINKEKFKWCEHCKNWHFENLSCKGKKRDIMNILNNIILNIFYKEEYLILKKMDLDCVSIIYSFPMNYVSEINNIKIKKNNQDFYEFKEIRNNNGYINLIFNGKNNFEL
jgi:hypothetical protein